MLKARFKEEYAALREAVRAERTKAGMKQEELAAHLGVHQSLVSDIETGQRRLDVIEFLAIARVLRVDPYAMLRKIEEALRF